MPTEEVRLSSSLLRTERLRTLPPVTFDWVTLVTAVVMAGVAAIVFYVDAIRHREQRAAATQASDEFEKRVAELRATCGLPASTEPARPESGASPLRRREAGTATSPATDEVMLAAATFSLCAAVIHATVAAAHLDVYPLLGLSFMVTSLLQAAWSFALWRRPSKGLLTSGVVLNSVAIGAWAMSRTVGLPMGNGPWTAEPLGYVDVLAVVLQTGVLLCASELWKTRSRLAPLAYSTLTTSARMSSFMALWITIGATVALQ